MTDPSSRPVDAATEKKHVFAWLLFPLALFPLMALLTYDWHAIASLNTPPVRTSNWIGALGDGFAYYGYLLFGLAIWIVPILCVIAGVCLIAGRRMRPGRRALWFSVFLFSVSCLLQVIGSHAGWVATVTERLNIANAGGALGYLTMTRLLAPLLSDFGSSVIMSILMVCSLIAAIGFHNLIAFCVAIYRWATVGAYMKNLPDAAETEAEPTDGDDEIDPREQAYLAALQAKAEAKRQREAEKEAARAAKKAEKEARRAAKEAEKEAARAAREQENRSPAPQREPFPGDPPAPRRPPAATKPAEQSEPAEDKGPYILPSLSLLKPLSPSTADHSDVGEMSAQLINTLKIFNVDATLKYTVQGPVVTKYAISLSPGTRYSAVTNISNELMGALHAKSLRIEAPIPGEENVGIEVPNKKPAGISFREIFESDTWKTSKAELPLLFGKDAAGRELVADLASMPHMLVAGATGQGKSVCLNSLICGLLMTRTPDQLKLIMVDPKMVEFTPYAAIPHLIVPVITENRKVVFSLHWAVAEMEKRLKLFARARVRNIYDFNHRKQFTQTDMFGDDTAVGSDMPRTIPYIVIIIDEAADLIGQCGKEVNPDIQRITQKARAAGIHLILATQRPDAKIITGTIKANIPGRVAFKTSSSVDSRTILDETGAENLIGKGDMLFRGKDNVLVRAQGAWISDEEIANVTGFIEQHSNTQFDDRFAKKLGTIKEAEVDIFADPEAEAAEEKEEAAAAKAQLKADENASDFKKAVECIIETHRASTSHFQRRLGWGYNHSAKIMDQLEDAGVIGPQQGAGPRPIVMDQDQLAAILNGDDTAGTANASPAPETEDATAETEEAQITEDQQ